MATLRQDSDVLTASSGEEGRTGGVVWVWQGVLFVDLRGVFDGVSGHHLPPVKEPLELGRFNMLQKKEYGVLYR